MTQEDKELLLKDLCARLPYGVIVYSNGLPHEQKLTGYIPDIEHYHIKPYLRPISSMTEEEKVKYQLLCDYYMDNKEAKHYFNNIATIDWYHQKHFDCRSLIKLGLALEAPEGMYDIK